MKKIITFVILLSLTSICSYADFNIQSLEIVDPEPTVISEPVVIIKKYTRVDNSKINTLKKENKSLNEKNKLFEEENNLIKKDIQDLKNQIENLSQLLLNPDSIKLPIDEPVITITSDLNEKQQSSLNKVEPVNLNNLNIFQKIDIYNSRVSKAAQKVIQSELDNQIVDVKILNLSLFDILELPISEIAYSDRVTIIPNMSKTGMLISIKIQKKAGEY